MVNLTQYTGVFRAFSASSDEARRGTRRNRQPLSCSNCRLRKLKCDREKPCEACVFRGDAASCEFVVHRKKKTARDAQARLDQLEQLVTTLATNGSMPTTIESTAETGSNQSNDNGQTISPPANSSPASETSVPLRPDSSYSGPTHWKAILEGIHEVQECLDVADPDFPNTSPSSFGDSPASWMEILFHHQQPVTRQEVLATLPAPGTVHRLLAIYFNVTFMTASFIHAPKFQRELDAFWADPEAASFLWLSMLFSMLYLAARQAVKTGSLASADNNTADQYMAKAGECLVAGEYMRPQPYVVEAMVLYATNNYTRSEDMDPVLWSLFGLATRQAQRMGYHRDPSRLSPTMSPFQVEMRRRVWFHVEAFDVLFSFQLGMPPITHEDECDTNFPRDLADGELSEDSPGLPPVPVRSTPTLLTYLCHKARQVRLFRRAVRLALSPRQPPDHEAIRKVDGEIHQLHEQVPACLRARAIATSSLADQGHTIMYRVMLEQQHLRSVCILHRVYLSCERDSPRFGAYRTACVTAALQLLDQQASIHREIQPGGRLHNEQHMAHTISNNGYLLAAMIVCLDLLVSRGNNPITEQNKTITTLKNAYSIVCGDRHRSRESHHAAKVLAAILAKVQSSYGNLQWMESPYQTTIPTEDFPSPPTMSSTDGGSTLASRVDPAINMDMDPDFDALFLNIDSTCPPLKGAWHEDLDWAAIDLYLREWQPSSTNPSMGNGH